MSERYIISPCLPAAEGTKKRHTTEELRELVKSVRSGTFHYDGRPKRSLHWASYNEAQLNEVAESLSHYHLPHEYQDAS